jgi:hypothetical protein
MEALGDLSLADALLEEPLDLGSVVSDGRRPAVRPPFLARLGDARLDPIAEDVPFELRGMRCTAYRRICGPREYVKLVG